MSSKKNLNALEITTKKKVKITKPREILNYKKTVSSPGVLSPTKILRAIKSQSAFNYAVPTGKKIVQPLNKGKLGLILKNTEKIDLFKGKNHPSPINCRNRTGFYSITDEDFDEIDVFLKQMNK